ncbi:MAG: 50S ribosomal protein L17 [Deltaproteobacteria bacterium]|nr:50S ribosomal protein L17 [Deltaproteobacteria bacterium]
MRHQVAGAKLGRTSSHREAMFRNMATYLFSVERITTTQPKAKALAQYAERLITLARRGDLHARRLAFRSIRNDAVLRKLFSELATRYQNRRGGYTRIIPLAEWRKGDAAPLAILELVDSPVVSERITKPKVKKKEKEREEAAKEKAKGAVTEKKAEVTEEKEVAEKPEKEEKGRWKKLKRMLGWHTKSEARFDKTEKKESHRKTAMGTGRSGSKKDSRGKAR